MIALRFLFSWVVFFAVMRLITWPMTRYTSKKATSDFYQKEGKRLRATPLKQCQQCAIHLPEHQGACFGEAFFCSETCRRKYYS